MLLYAGGYHLAYHIYQFGLKSEMKSYILHHQDAGLGELIFINTDNGHIKDNQFQWEEEGEEFRYGGIYYDVISISKTTQGLRISCLKDRAENSLETQIISIRQKEHANKKNASSSQFKFQPFCQSDTKQVFKLARVLGFIGTNFTNIGLPSTAKEIQLPPPRC